VLDDMLRNAIDEGLPANAAAVIRRAVARARLWPGECADVVAELVTHFEDGIDEGEHTDALIAAFGDPRLTATMIARAKRRQRPTAWHALRTTAVVATGACGLAVLAYLGSSSLLYLHHPAIAHRIAPATVDASVARARRVATLHAHRQLPSPHRYRRAERRE
jgi:hypothetical protein